MLVSKGNKMLYKVHVSIKEVNQPTMLIYSEEWDISSVMEQELFKPILNEVISDEDNTYKYYAVLLENDNKEGLDKKAIFDKGRTLICDYMGMEVQKIHFSTD